MSDDITAQVLDALEAAAIPYMLVGSMATNLYGIPRSTKDADFVVDASKADVYDIFKHLGPQFHFDRQLRFETVTATIQYILLVEGSDFRIDLFELGKDPHDQERFRRRRRVASQTLGREPYLPAIEDAIVTKLRWAAAGRGKDREDIRDMIVTSGEGIDWDYVYRWCDQHQTRRLLDEIRNSIPPV